MAPRDPAYPSPTTARLSRASEPPRSVGPLRKAPQGTHGRKQDPSGIATCL